MRQPACAAEVYRATENPGTAKKAARAAGTGNLDWPQRLQHEDPLEDLAAGERGRVVRVLGGDARVRTYPDTAAGNAPLIPLEVAARADGRCLWGKGAWTIHDAARLPGHTECFHIAEGISGAMKGSDERIAVCDAALRNSALIFEIQKAAAGFYQLQGGTLIRACGFLLDGRLEVSHSLNLQELGEVKPPE